MTVPMPIRKCTDCGATMVINYSLGLCRSTCPRCMYYEDYHKDADTGQMWCIDSGYLTSNKDIKHCTRCHSELNEQRVKVKIQGESILAERHELCRTCFDVIKYWLSSNSRTYQPKQ